MKEIIGFEEKKELPIGSCFFGHKWTKWETFSGNIFHELKQKRYCIKCNKLETRDC